MNGPRVVLATRRFWPQTGVAETCMGHLALELAKLGARPVVLTAQADKSWPTEVRRREIPVVRLPHPTTMLWGSYRYLGAVSRWLREHKGEYDLVCASSLRFQAYTILGALADTRVPVVLRAERGGPDGDCQWQRKANFGARVRRRCLAAQSVVAPSESIAGELRATGYTAKQVQVIPNGAPLAPPRDAERRAFARGCLAEAHPILGVAEGTPLVVCTSRFVEGKGLVELVDAWPAVQRRWQHAKLWLIGQGPLAEKIWRRIEHWELKHDVIMTGLFDELEDVYAAADLLVRPSTAESSSQVLLEAMAAGLPIVATDLPATREVLPTAESALLIPPGNAAALSGAMIQLLADRTLAQSLAIAARRRAEEEFSVEKMALGHLELFERLLTKTTA